MSETPTIYHIFADRGTESEVLDACGRVVRVGLDPVENSASDAVKADATALPLQPGADLALLHPPCTRWSDMPDVDPDDHADLIERAREIGEAVAEDYVIENKPRAPLRDPTTLHGRMFGLPLAYERAFEATFPIRAPARHQPLGDKTVSPYYYSDRSAEWWAATKGYRGDYPKQHLAKNALPAAYVRTLLRSWLESRDTRDAEVPQDNNDPAPRTVEADQATLTGGER